MSADREPGETAFERRSRELLTRSADGLSAQVRSRLNRSRQQASAELARNAHAWRWRLPAGAFAAAAAAAVTLVWVSPRTSERTDPARTLADGARVPAVMTTGAAADFDLLVDGEALDLTTSGDPAFHEWAVAQRGFEGPS